MVSDKGLDYKNSGVDIDEGNRFVSVIKKTVESTYNKNVMGSIGGFAGFFDISAAKDMAHPVLVSGTDGVGTKLKVAIDSDILNTVGVDLVAMCVNDIIVTGAKPLFFLDYMATGKLSSEKMAQVVEGIAEGCRQAGSPLVGGETAEMPGMYSGEDFDLAGFAVGILDKPKAVTGERISKGDVLVGLPSSGLHSNGYSLARKLFFEKLSMKPDDILYDDVMLKHALLEPTRIYVQQVLSVIEKGIDVKGMVHITGGGFYDNIPRILPEGAGVKINPDAFPTPGIYKFILEKSGIEEKELYRVFNMGIGYIMVLEHSEAEKCMSLIDDACVIGNVTDTGIVEIEGIN
ncbi:phosphoribosylformylglycinamidine cyclo-ligase [Denitrovibrio acetiphilus DSM 12809]|uniref:Phosphoribosylformylglycinamidine cyclo-ligase n=1 Tax=Denitrovibrio acetiphilus (strain DSM 12809 / NBRC 114555 / N2460) TaxID=522772 RepID=D4H765_DENA2|nr:phosphoribosylformylglycinamidine cyclo-ligase [Denitrovibrio acetiphilus]ADD69769.1 phosphoribosylformylglycinamidine cyclo-ligase [Denitrovibrio acetiphilus DSM 12809]